MSGPVGVCASVKVGSRVQAIAAAAESPLRRSVDNALSLPKAYSHMCRDRASEALRGAQECRPKELRSRPRTEGGFITALRNLWSTSDWGEGTTTRKESGPLAPLRKYDEDERVREQVSLLVGMLGSQYSEAQTSAVVQLSRLGPPSVPYIVQALTAPEDAEGRGSARSWTRDRRDLIRVLGMIAAPGAVEPLSRILEGGTGRYGGSGASGESEEGMAVEALGKIGTPEALDAVVQNLGNLDPEVAWEAISRYGDAGIASLIRVLESGKSGQKRVAARLVRSIPDARVVPALLKSLSGDSEDLTKAAVIDALAELGDSSAIPALRALLASPLRAKAGNLMGRAQDDVRGHAVDALGRLGGASVVPELLRELRAGDHDARSAIVRIGHPAVPALAKALAESDADTAKVVAGIITEIKSNPSGHPR